MKHASIQKTPSMRGMTLVEVAISIAILGFMLAGAIVVYDSAEDQRKVRVTQERMDTIMRALSTYVESANRLPCPADTTANILPGGSAPVFGWERGVTANDTRVINANARLPRGNCDATSSGSGPGGEANRMAAPGGGEVEGEEIEAKGAVGEDEGGEGGGAMALRTAGSDAYKAEGIVPFMTLDIPEEVVRDGWGNYFTYAISPIFAQQSDFSGETEGPGDSGQVSQTCRTRSWIKNGDNVNAPKANFCCTRPLGGGLNDVGSDIVMYLTSEPGSPLTLTRASIGSGIYDDMTSGNTDGLGVPGPLSIGSRNAVSVPAVVLISHGPNGFGAFLANGTDARRQFNVEDEGDNYYERINAGLDDTRIYYTGRPNRTAGPDYFDDIVMWRTQNGIMSYNGTSSCALP